MYTKQSNFPIGWVLAIVSAIVIGLIKFFSLNFRDLGRRTDLNIIWACVYALLLLGVVAVLVKAKKVSIPLNFRKAAIVELCMLIVYAVLLIAGVICTNHFYVVMSRKDIIKEEVTKQINQIDSMFESYNNNFKNRVTAYDEYLQQVENIKNSDCSRYCEEELDTYSREDLVIYFKAEIDCGEVQQSIANWKNNMLSKTEGLGLITLMPRVNEINENLKNARDSLKELDRKSEKGLNGLHWNYTLTTSNDILEHFKFQKGEPFSLWAFVVIIIAAIIILLPYIAAERDGRHKGLFWELTHSREGVSHKSDSAITGI